MLVRDEGHVPLLCGFGLATATATATATTSDPTLSMACADSTSPGEWAPIEADGAAACAATVGPSNMAATSLAATSLAAPSLAATSFAISSPIVTGLSCIAKGPTIALCSGSSTGVPLG